MTVLTPKAQKEALRKRLEAVKKLLPTSWIATFMHVFPEYKGFTTFLHNVNKGLSLDADVIEKMETLAQKLSA